jgi:tRNA pseudouridine65 synthase
MIRMSPFSILFQSHNLVVIDKPAGFHVHPPESKAEKVPRHKIILHQLRDQIGCRVYPLHRLDVGTSGVLVFALNPEAASFWGRQFQQLQIEKTYWTVVRGHLPDVGEIDRPLESDSTGTLVPCQTLFRTLFRMEIPRPVGKRHGSARYSWLEVRPLTGRFHQIRRHMNRISHPVIGDAAHGDSHHNRFFREQLGLPGLCLRAVNIQLPAEKEGEWIKVSAPRNSKWDQISELFQVNQA